MILDGPVLAWLTLALLPIALPVFLAVILARFSPVKPGCLPLVGLLIIGLLAGYGMCAYLDHGGNAVQGEVLVKHESLVYHLDGSWDRKLLADIRYNSSYTGLPNTETLNLIPSRFDEMHQGDFLTLRDYEKVFGIRIVRLEDQKVIYKVWSWAGDQTFLFFFVLGFLLILAVRYLRRVSLPLLFFLGCFVTIGAWWIANVAAPLWEQAELLAGSLNTASANVREVHPPYLGSGIQGWIATKIFKPYDLTLVDMVPLGRSESVLGVDAVDMGTANLRPGQNVNVRYEAGNPRVTLIPDGERSYVWKNALLRTLLAVLMLATVGRVAFLMRDKSDEGRSFLPTRRRKRRKVA